MTSQADDAILAGIAEANRDDYEHSLEKAGAPADLIHPAARLAKGVDASDSDYDIDAPTDAERVSLRHVPEAIPWTVYLIAICELAERFSYYGSTVVFTNFIQQPLPSGPGTNPSTGAGGADQTSGALGMGQRAAFGLTTFNTFWVYVTPILGAWIADTYWGRYKTICWAVLIAIIGHILLIVCAVPGVIESSNGSIACFSIAIVIMGMGTGWFKSNISPLIAEQTKTIALTVHTLPSGERVIKDPTLTIARIFMYFYLFINIGALVGQIGMTYSEKYVGFWLAYTLPTIVFLLCPIVLYIGRNRYVKTPPTGSVMAEAMRLWRYAMKGRWTLNPVRFVKNVTAPDFWENAKPSRHTGESRPSWMTFDDVWVDEVRRGLKACVVFCWFPVYWLCYNQMIGNLTSQAAVMETHGIPNDVLNNLDPFALIILIPLCDILIYPALRKAGINFSPLKKITLGFFTASLSMVWAAVIQYYIYKKSACGNQAATCETVAPINVWTQTGSYVLIAISEIFASITGLEYAFTKAPKNMRSLVMAAFLFTNAVSAALGQAFVSVSADPLLIWNYGIFAVMAFLAGIGFWISFRKLDAQEEELNQIGQGKKLVEHVEPSRIESEKN